jgi:hypothetical protein
MFWRQVQTSIVPREGGCLQVVVQWWILMTGVVVRVNQKPLYTLMITIQKVTSNVQSVPRQTPDI